MDYLLRRATGAPCRAPVIAEVDDIYEFEPWDLPGKAMFGGREWYFFHRREHKYGAGANTQRTKRSTKSGYWKAMGTDKPITLSADDDDTTLKTLGFKKALVFYRGRAPNGVKSSWIMHEYRLHDNPVRSNESASSTSSTSVRVYVPRAAPFEFSEYACMSGPSLDLGNNAYSLRAGRVVFVQIVQQDG